VTLAFLILFGAFTGTGPALYWTLLVVGLGALLSSFGFLLWQDELSSRAIRTSSTSAAVRPPSAPPPRKDPTKPAPPQVHYPHPDSGLGRAAVSAAFRPGDELWQHWTTPLGRPLGVEAAGPVAESWFSPAKAGAVAPFAGRDHDTWVLSDDRRTVVRGGPAGVVGGSPSRAPAPPKLARASTSGGIRAHPFTELELDTLFPMELELDRPSPLSPDRAIRAEPRKLPPVTTPTEPTPSIPAASASVEPHAPLLPPVPSAPWEEPGPKAAAALAEADPLLGGPDGLPTLDSIDHQVYLEALNPTPPHLRSSIRTDAKRAGPREARSSARRYYREFCAMCARKLSDFRSWVECPRCSQPMCRECLDLSFLTGAEGRCLSCREPNGPSAG